LQQLYGQLLSNLAACFRVSVCSQCRGRGPASEHSMAVVAKTRYSQPRMASSLPKLHRNATHQNDAMKPGSLPTRLRSRPVCQLCDFITHQPTSRRAFVSASTLKAPTIRRQPARSHVAVPRPLLRSVATTARQLQELEDEHEESLPLSDRIAALKGKLADVEERLQAIYDTPRVQSEAVLLQVLEQLEDIARHAISIRSRQPLRAKATIRQSSAGAILSGLSEENATTTTRKTKSKSFGLDALPTPAHLSKLAEDFIKHPNVFLSANILGLYIHLQRMLARPRTIPEALYLYAHKPVPEEGSKPPKYTTPSPKSAKHAIPPDLADAALTAAIESKDLTLALTVVDHTYCAPAWRRHRMLTKLGFPSVLAGLTPFAIYMLAQEASVYSGYIDPWTFKVYAFAGISTYVLCTTTLGFVALTTYNDHHDRVVWRPGVPLLDRYMREKESWKRGDEEGEEWEGLRQWILLRGMVLDKPDLMPGMNPGR
jgi:hypothetical protein